MQLIAGVDEAGRGPLAGPVVAAAVVFDLSKEIPIRGLRDSKQLTEKQREALYDPIIQNAIAWGIGSASASEIDEMNILKATLLAMRRAVLALKRTVEEAWVDGNRAPDLPCPVRTIIGGDASEPLIAAASILAKVTRDRWMQKLDIEFPGYAFAQHKGYGTALHLERLRALGASHIHRRSFAPVKAYSTYNGLNKDIEQELIS